jgi:hypothetical protein
MGVAKHLFSRTCPCCSTLQVNRQTALLVEIDYMLKQRFRRGIILTFKISLLLMQTYEESSK